MTMMQETLERPNVMAAITRTSSAENSARSALWIVDILATELAADASLDREALVSVLQQMAGYEQADPLRPNGTEARRAELVARLADRLAQGR